MHPSLTSTPRALLQWLAVSLAACALVALSATAAHASTGLTVLPGHLTATP